MENLTFSGILQRFGVRVKIKKRIPGRDNCRTGAEASGLCKIPAAAAPYLFDEEE
ncbi:hypothetical protein GCM10010969_33490 [Saccharibacillus kuerlensis]|uniref:Uncharacterized protein n=1 Tax=Saccharibacillus kuerlensis TaxID=459527 RepID=A0ABQ2L7R0_9BACL|nr:hypothetical protein GCM10010969_33490 [Saccharibacillus kuerlensis]